MAWTRPVLREVCIGLEINGYLAARMESATVAQWRNGRL